MPSIFAYRSYLLFWSGQTVSYMGDALRRITLMLWVFAASDGSGLAIAALTIAELVPYTLLSPFAGVLVDRLNKRGTLIVCNLARAALSLLLIFFIANQMLPLLYIVVALATTFSVFADVAENTIVPKLVKDESLEEANSIAVVGQQLSFVVGPALGALLYKTFGAPITFLLDSLTFLYAAATLVSLRRLATEILATNVVAPLKRGMAWKVFWSDFVGGFRYIAQTSLIVRSFWLALLLAFSSGINNTVMIFFISRGLGRDPADIAWLSAANGIAQMLVGGYLVFTARRTGLRVLITASTAVLALGAVLVAGAWSLPGLILGVVITSLGNSPFNVTQSTISQRYVKTSFLGRVKGTTDTASTLAFLAAATLSGWAVDITTPRTMLWASASMMIALNLAAVMFVAPLVSPRLRGVKEEGSMHESQASCPGP